MKTWMPVIKGFAVMLLAILFLGAVESFAGSSAQDLGQAFSKHTSR